MSGAKRLAPEKGVLPVRASHAHVSAESAAQTDSTLRNSLASPSFELGSVRVRTYSSDELAALLPMPDFDANKYSRGKLTIVGGSAAYPGAACIAAAASQRAGAGYTEVRCAPEAMPVIQAFRPSVVVRSWKALVSEDFAATSLRKPCAYVVGCGLDASTKQGAVEAKELVCAVVKQAHAPVLVDGGGLSALATRKGQRLLRRRFVNGWPTVITPHMGEAARLAKPFGFPTSDPARLACLLALAYGVVAVVKGPDTYVSDGETVTCIDEGTPALAKAGTGDALAGVLGALLAQGLSAVDAAVLATVLHARAGKAAAQQLTDIGVAAEDVVEALPDAIGSVAEGKSRFRRFGNKLHL